MKIHNLGSDYTFSRSLKAKRQTTEMPDNQISKKEILDNAGDKIPSGGEGAAMADTEQSPQTNKKSKKKKEAGAENGQSED